MSYERVGSLVSVVVPYYNAERYIVECLNSINSQTYGSLEIIVVDDASSDDSASKIWQWHSRNKSTRFLMLRLPRNSGFSGALTTGFFLARGEFIAVHDADDFSHPDRIRKQVEFLRSRPEIGLVGTNYIAFEDGDFSKQIKPIWLSYGDDILPRYAAGDHCISHPTILFRGTVFDALGGLNRKIKGAEDYEFIARCIQNGIKVDNLPEPLYYYRRHPEQRSREFYS